MLFRRLDKLLIKTQSLDRSDCRFLDETEKSKNRESVLR